MEQKNTLTPLLSHPTKENARPLASFDKSSWKDEPVGLHWINVDYPYLHTHDHYEIFVILDGKITHYINGKEFQLKKGDACLIRPNDKHKLFFNKKSEKYLHVNFIIKPFYMEKILQSYSESMFEYANAFSDFSPFQINDFELSLIKASAVKIHAFKQYSEKDVILCKSIITRLISIFIEQRYIKESDTIPEWLNNFLGFLYDPTSFTMPISELAKKTSYSHSRLYKIFKNYFNTSLVVFHTNIKLSYAKELLAKTDKTTLDICNIIGFSSLSHFNHAFKKKYNIPPTQYRKLKNKR